MKKAIIATAIATMLTTTTLACPTMLSYGYCTCGMCGAGYQAQQTICYDRTGEGYYDSQGHYCQYGGYWDSGCWIQTVGYYEGGEWVPAQYDPMLDVGYYDECGGYHLYGGCQSQSYGGYGYGYGYGYTDCGLYDETDTWACDNRQWLEEQDYGYEEYEEYGYDDCYIDLDLDANVINIINNGVIVFSGTCTVADIYRGQELAFDSQRCAGIWNTCSSGFYEQACGYNIGSVCCH